MAAGFAELKGQKRQQGEWTDRWRVCVVLGHVEGLDLTNLSTTLKLLMSTAASSLMRCGLFPVDSSCCRTPTTISSLMPSVSILVFLELPGEGGGVCWAPGPAGRCRGGESGAGAGVVEVMVCERLRRFAGGSVVLSPVAEVVGGRLLLLLLLLLREALLPGS